jgi:hypothetical protein
MLDADVGSLLEDEDDEEELDELFGMVTRLLERIERWAKPYPLPAVATAAGEAAELMKQARRHLHDD